MLANLPPIVPRVLGQTVSWLVRRKTPALAAGCALSVLLIIVAVSSRMNALTPLFAAPLHPSQTLEVERALTIWNEPFMADAQHTQLFVPALHRRDVLLRLTLAGLPHRFVPTTSEVLEQQESAFAPQSSVDDRRRAGIEGDLVAGLRRSNGVADATVVIAPAVADPLLGDDARAPASASVQLVMQSGAVLSPSAISGMKRFVAAAYPGLTPERVVIVDGTGSLAGASQVTVDRAGAREQRLQSSIQSALDEVFGAGAAIVRVSLRSSGLERTSQSTRVTPHGLLESDSGKEHGSDGGKHFERDRDRTRYAYDTVVEHQASHADAVAHVAVAVFLDARKVAADQVASVKDLVRAAAGADLAAGDDVAVQALPFAADQSVTPRRLPANVMRLVAVALIALCLCAGGWYLRSSHVTTQMNERQTAAAMLGVALERELPQTTAYVLSSMPPTVRANVLREYPPELRQQIERHMNGHAHG